MSEYTPTPPDPHYALGGLAMAATLALNALPKHPREAQQTLTQALKGAEPHMSEELRTMLKDAR